MADASRAHVFFSYSQESQDFVDGLARRLQSDARLAFWYAPWHSIPGAPILEQMEDALWQAQSCAVFVGSPGRIEDWQNEQMRIAIQTRIEDDASYRVIPVLVPGTARPSRRDLPLFLRRYEMVEFHGLDDEQAFRRLLAGILGIPPIEVDGYIQTQRHKEQQPPPPSGGFEHGHALLIGVAHYPHVRALPETVLDDALDLHALLVDPIACGYSGDHVLRLLDDQATGDAIRAALAELAARAVPDDTAVVYFSGHGAHDLDQEHGRRYILPYDCETGHLDQTAICGHEMTAMLRQIKVGRLLVLLDSCHSGGVGNPKALAPQVTLGLDANYYQLLAQGQGRVVIGSSRPEELSWTVPGMRNSLFTHYLLEALRGNCRTLGDGYVRVFDLFRHVADRVPRQAAEIGEQQHPIFKASAMEDDFAIAWAGN